MSTAVLPKAKDTADHIAIARAVREAIGAEDVLFHRHAFWRFRDRGVWAKVEGREVQLAEGEEAVKAVISKILAADMVTDIRGLDSSLEALRSGIHV
jgi:hypothetical protein